MPQTLETIETIGDVEYTVYPLDPLTAIDLSVDIGKTLGPAFGALFGGAGGIEEVVERKVDFGAGAALLFQHLDKATLRAAMKTLAKVTHAGGVPLDPIFAAHFHGKLGVMMRWFAFALKVQFADFFEGWGGGAGLAGILASLQSRSPSTSTGLSGNQSSEA